MFVQHAVYPYLPIKKIKYHRRAARKPVARWQLDIIGIFFVSGQTGFPKESMRTNKEYPPEYLLFNIYYLITNWRISSLLVA